MVTGAFWAVHSVVFEGKRFSIALKGEMLLWSITG
jgi:uncharacterized membrane protein